MSQLASAGRSYYRVACFLLFFIAAAASFHGFYSKWHFREQGAAGASNPVNRFEFEKMVDGTAERPFAYRRLLPDLANGIDRAAPQSLKSALAVHAGLIATFIDSPLIRDPAYELRYLVVYAASFLFALLAVFAMYLACRAVHAPPAAAVISSVAFILLFPYFLSIGGYFYDYPELLFLALAVWMAARFRWWWLVPIVALGTWNKESFLLFVPALYPLIRVRHSRLAASLGGGVLCAVSIAVYLPIRAHFAGNPGGTVLMHWSDQLHFFAHPRNVLLGVDKTYGVPTLAIATLLPVAFIVWTVWRAWPQLPMPIRRHGQIAAAINIPLYLLFCMPGELRDLSMLFVFFVLAMAANLTQWLVSGARDAAEPASLRIG